MKTVKLLKVIDALRWLGLPAETKSDYEIKEFLKNCGEERMIKQMDYERIAAWALKELAK